MDSVLQLIVWCNKCSVVPFWTNIRIWRLWKNIICLNLTQSRCVEFWLARLVYRALSSSIQLKAFFLFLYRLFYSLKARKTFGCWSLQMTVEKVSQSFVFNLFSFNIGFLLFKLNFRRFIFVFLFPSLLLFFLFLLAIDWFIFSFFLFWVFVISIFHFLWILNSRFAFFCRRLWLCCFLRFFFRLILFGKFFGEYSIVLDKQRVNIGLHAVVFHDPLVINLFLRQEEFVHF